MVPRNGSQCSLSPYCVPGAERDNLPTSLFSRGSDLPWATQLVSTELVFEPQPEMSEAIEKAPGGGVPFRIECEQVL